MELKGAKSKNYTSRERAIGRTNNADDIWIFLPAFRVQSVGTKRAKRVVGIRRAIRSVTYKFV